jgi:hypothetical protein
MMQDFHDTTFLPFPRRNQKAKMDEQFGKFVEVIQKLYINIPLLDAIQVPHQCKVSLRHPQQQETIAHH